MPKSVSEIILKVEEEIVEALDNSKGWIEKTKAVIRIVVPEIEELYEALPGSQKKVEATKVINALLEKYVKIPLPKFIVNFIVSKLIDGIVSAFNKAGIFTHK